MARHFCQPTTSIVTQKANVRQQFNMNSWQLHDLEVLGDKIVITPAPDVDKIRSALKQNLYKKGFTDESLYAMALQQQK